jgi:hypothetical protein
MNYTYIIRHWILTLLSGPIIFILISQLSNPSYRNVLSFFEIYPIMIIMGFMFSTPTYLLLIFIFMFIEEKSIKNLYKKIFFMLTVIIGIWTTTTILGGTLSDNIAISYTIGTCIFGLILKSNFNLPCQS